MSRAAVAGGAVGVLTAAALTGGAALGLHTSNLHNGLLALSFVAVGLYVVRRRPRHRAGLLLTATGLAHAVMFVCRQYGLHTSPLPGASWVGWLGVWPLPLVLALLGLTVMSFPTGRLPSPAWRPVVVILAALAVVLATMSALWPVDWARAGMVPPYPLQLPGAAAAQAVYEVARPVGYLAFQVVWAACVVVRLRRARGDEARQLRGFVYAVAATAVVMVAGVVLLRSPLPGVLVSPLIAVAAGAAILRYRLYDIDPVINKTIVVGAMALLVTFGYVGIVTAAGALVRGRGVVLSLAATAVVAVAFEPLRRRVQRLADRLVYGQRATPYEALSRLSAQLASPTAGLLDGVCATAADGVGARAVTLWVGSPTALHAVCVWPATRTPPPQERRFDEVEGEPVVHDGRVLGVLSVEKPPGDALSTGEQRLLTDLAAQAGLILELRASAQRLVVADAAARRRLERDLHDGAQHRLVTAAVELGGLARAATSTGSTDLADRAESARLLLLEAAAELRELARGLHPAVLTQDGLEAALGYLADRSSVPVRLTVGVDRRLPPEVESTAYFLVSEALANVAKHAAATVVSVRAHLGSTGLELQVADDGAGGAAVLPGGGLEGLRDRLRALDARLTLDSDVGGTRLATVIPCA